MGNVPMTRPHEMLAEHRTNYFHDSTFVEISGERILHCSGTRFSTSDDGGITWSEAFKKTDKNGDPVGGGGTSLVKLDGKGVGLAAFKRGVPDHPDWAQQFTHMVYWRSDDEGASWSQIGDFPLGRLDEVKAIEGDKDVGGRVYIGFSGSGYVYGIAG